MELTVATYEMPDGSNRVEITHGGYTKSFTPDELDAYIVGLAQVRESMQPPRVSSQPAPPQTISAVVDPRWHSQYEPLSNGSLLTVCHPAFGWLAFAFPKESLAQLHDFHVQQLLIAVEAERTSSRN
ncbi:hypothetical protein [Pandoraea sputorum]|uniref:hypothetical protein n=1 Tax=Pandoraea sputorum TaxID=93222 RepID=UPI0012404D92|nr:hypothetical protein [Pandoraea sputorum]VVE78145.1 hypothetical protein PSP31120_01525 [Pandoraea sputorum]